MKIALNQMKISQDMRDGFQAFFFTVQVYQAGMYAMIKKDHGVWLPNPFRVSPRWSILGKEYRNNGILYCKLCVYFAVSCAQQKNPAVRLREICHTGGPVLRAQIQTA